MLKIIIALTIFAVLHSWLAGQSIKRSIRQRIGERAYHGFYRLAYNVFAGVTLAPAFFIAALDSREIIWRVEGWAVILLVGIQIIGVIGVLVSLVQIDTWRFAGLRQMRAYLNGETLPLPDEELQLKGTYALVRHPLYLFSLLAIWPMAIMTGGLLAFNTGATLYFIFGSLLEEKRLATAYGDTYRNYQRDVPWLIPLPRIRH